MSKSKKRQNQRVQQRRTTTRPTVVSSDTAKTEQDKRRSRAQRAAVAKKLGVIVLALALVSAIGYLVLQKVSSNVDAPAIGAVDQELVLGEEGAPHEVIIYEDFRCPACGALERALDGELAELAAAGDVRIAYRPFDLLGGWAEDAAAAFAVVLEESEPEVAAEFHDLLYSQQPGEGDDTPSTDWFVALATQAGADADAVRAGIESGAGDDWVERATEAADDAGVNSTPTVLLDGDVFEEDKAPDDRARALLDALR